MYTKTQTEMNIQVKIKSSLQHQDIPASPARKINSVALTNHQTIHDLLTWAIPPNCTGMGQVTITITTIMTTLKIVKWHTLSP